MKLFTNLLLFFALFAGCAFAQDRVITKTYVLKPGQRYTIYRIPMNATIHITSGFPVNVYYANCHEDQIIDTEITCPTQSDRLVMIDSRNHRLGRYNQVQVTVSY